MRLKSYRVTSQVIFLFLSILGVVGLSTGLIFPYYFCTASPGHTAACPLWVLEHGSITLWSDPRLALISFFYLLGLLGIVGFFVGRAFCGWACPVGFLQELYAKIRRTVSIDLPKIIGLILFGLILIVIPQLISSIITGYLGLVGVVLLVLGLFGFVLLYRNPIISLFLLIIGLGIMIGSIFLLDYPEFPAFIGLFLILISIFSLLYDQRTSVKNSISRFIRALHLKPTQIKYIILIFIPISSFVSREFLFTDLDPIGGVVATIPTLLMEPSGWTAGTYFWPKMVFVIMFFVLILVIGRAWCKFLCPIGALMAPTNRISVTDININQDKCIRCKKCNKACPMDIDVMNYHKDLECVRCGRCVDVCNYDAAHINAFNRELH